MMESSGNTRADRDPEPRSVWRAMGAYAAAVVLLWTVGAYWQWRYGVWGLGLAGLACVALPAGAVLWRERGMTGGAGWGRPTRRALGWAGVLGLVVLLVAVGKGVATRQALGLPVQPVSWSGWWIVPLVAVARLSEELLFRPVLQRAFSRIWRPSVAVGATALLAGLLPGSPARFPEVFVLGLFGGVLYLKTGNFWVSAWFQGVAGAAAPAGWWLATNWPALAHPLTTLGFTAVALWLAWQVEPPGAHRVWGVWAHVRWALFGRRDQGGEVVSAGVGPGVAYGAGVLLMLGVMVLAAMAGATGEQRAQAGMRVGQADLWRLGADGVIRAQSRIEYEQWPARRENLSFALPYTEARVERAEVAGQPVRVTPVGAGTFQLIWPARLPAGPRTIHVYWAMPLGAMEAAAAGYQARLQALVPVTAYSLRLWLEAGCGYEFEGAPERPQTELFSIRDTGRSPRNHFGTCGVGLRRRPGG